MNDALRDEIIDYSNSNRYRAERFASPRCTCGNASFAVAVDDNEGAAVRICSACGDKHAIGDSDDYLDGAELETCACPCGGESFDVGVGVALYDDKKAIRWVYLGCTCTACHASAVYADWKCEVDDVDGWLAKV